MQAPSLNVTQLTDRGKARDEAPNSARFTLLIGLKLRTGVGTMA